MKSQAERLRDLLAARKWDLEYCKLVCELFVCAGLPESEAVRVTKEVFALPAARG